MARQHSGADSADSTAGDHALVDIGVDADRARARSASLGGRSARPRWGVLTAILAVAVLVAVIVGLLDRGDDTSANERPSVRPTSAPRPESTGLTESDAAEGTDAGEDVTSVAGQEADSPLLAAFPVVNDGLSRAGEECRFALDPGAGDVVFRVPDGHTMVDCRDLVRNPVTRDTVVARVTLVPENLGHVLSTFTGADSSQVASMWQPIDGLRGYRLTTSAGTDSQEVQLVAVGDQTVVATRSASGSGATDERAFDALAQSIALDAPARVPERLPMPGGWCAGDHFVTQVPDGWFAGEACRWMNTSSESPTVMACDCFPPLWIEHGSIPFDSDFGFRRVDLDRLVPREDGSVIRIMEGMRRDPNNFERPLRIVVVDLGVERVIVAATEFPEHAAPGHTWQETLEAQQEVVDQLVAHSDPACTGERGVRVVSDTESTLVPFARGDVVDELVVGTLVEPTGCSRPATAGRQVEFRVVAEPSIVGWIEAAALVEPDLAACATVDDGGDEWAHSIRGDFDGDGRIDIARIGVGADAVVGVTFANGGESRSLLVDPSTGPNTAGADRAPTVERLLGAGRDLLGVLHADDDSSTYALYDLRACSPAEVPPLVELTTRADGDAELGWCRVQTGAHAGLREWHASPSDHRLIGELDRVWWGFGGNDELGEGPLVAVGAPPVSDPRCGPRLDAPLQPIRPESGDDTLAGDHRLTLQWITIETREAGSIEFRPVGVDRYVVEGSHRHPDGTAELTVRGVIEVVAADAWRFEGTVTSRVDRLNDGAPCVRTAGQWFFRQPESNAFRMQDRINCDGARTDWIDIVPG